jgi:hypothetical protein
MMSVSILCLITQAICTRYIGIFHQNLSEIIIVRAGHGLGELIIPTIIILSSCLEKKSNQFFMVIALWFLFSATSLWRSMIPSGEIPRQDTVMVTPACAAAGRDYAACGGIHMDTQRIETYTGRSQAEIINHYLMIAYSCWTLAGIAYVFSAIRILYAYKKTIRDLEEGPKKLW